MARETKTEAARAQAALDVVTRKVERGEARKDELERELRAVVVQLEADRKMQAYKAANPALPQAGASSPAEPSGDV